MYHINSNMIDSGLFDTPGACGSVGGSYRKGGKNCLCGSNSILLFSGFFLWIITTILFLLGGVSDKLICQTLEDPVNSEIYNATNEALNTLFHDALGIEELNNITFSYDKIIESCGNPETSSIYNVFDLQYVYNISDLKNWKEEFEINEMIASAKTEINKGIDDLVNDLQIDPDIENQIRQIADTFLELTDDVFDKIKTINISELVPQEQLDSINDTISKLPTAIDQTLVSQVQEDIEEIEKILSEDVQNHLTDTIEFVSTFSEKLIYNNTCDINCTVNLVFGLVENASDKINNETRNRIIGATDTIIDSILDLGKNDLGLRLA